MRNMFKELFNKSGYKYDYQYDWVILAEKKEKVDKKEEKIKEQNMEEWGCLQLDDIPYQYI